MPESPIGSIIAFGGSRITRGWEAQSGWLHCDGRLLDNTELEPNGGSQLYKDLFQAIGFAWGGDGDTKFNLPGLQGFFLRGVDPPTGDFGFDPDHGERARSAVGGNMGNSVGSVQLSATALPKGNNKFMTAQAGDHKHTMNFETTASRDVADSQFNTVAFPGTQTRPETGTAGVHVHEIVGGDHETRPINAYVYWIIRFR